MRFHGKVCVVTGAASGIGRAVAERCAAEGGRVALFDRDPAGEEVAARLRAAGAVASFHAVDLTDEAAVASALRDAEAAHRRITTLFNIAGASGRALGDGPVEQCPVAAWDWVMATNLRSVFLVCKHGIPALRRAGGGAIVNVASVVALLGHERFATHAYTASKGGVVALTRALAVYYARERIRVNCLCPGLVATPMSERAQADPEIRALLPEIMPLLGDFAAPEDPAAAALFLASDDAAAITGAILPVDAGWSAR